MKYAILITTLIFLTSCSSVINYGGKSYQYVHEPVSWTEAKTLAEERGGTLAVFESIEALATVESKLPKGKIFWVGLSDAEQEGRWVWLDGTRLRADMAGKIVDGGNLEARDYGYILLQGGLGSRANSGVLPRGWRGRPQVDGFLMQFDQ